MPDVSLVVPGAKVTRLPFEEEIWNDFKIRANSLTSLDRSQWEKDESAGDGDEGCTEDCCCRLLFDKACSRGTSVLILVEMSLNKLQI